MAYNMQVGEGTAKQLVGYMRERADAREAKYVTDKEKICAPIGAQIFWCLFFSPLLPLLEW